MKNKTCSEPIKPLQYNYTKGEHCFALKSAQTFTSAPKNGQNVLTAIYKKGQNALTIIDGVITK